MERHAFPNRTTWFIVCWTIALIVLVWAMGALAILNIESADAEFSPASDGERVSGLEAKVVHLEDRNAALESRLETMEREYAEQKTILDDLIRRDEARREEAPKD